MSHQFKPGDLAVIVGGFIPDVIGLVVELEEFHPGGEHFSFSGDLFEGPDHDYWIVSADSLRAVNALHGYEPNPMATALACHLLPLRGDFEPEQQKAKEAEPCL